MRKFFLFLFIATIAVVNAAVFLDIPRPVGSVIVLINKKDGVGNFMFRFAAGYALAEKTDSKLYVMVNEKDIPKRKNEKSMGADLFIENFKIDPKLVKTKNFFNSKYLKSTKVDEKNFFSLASHKNTQVLLVDGDFESDIFFKDYKSDIQNIFTPIYELSSLKEDLRKVSEPEVFCIHVRRGNITKHRVLDIDYQKRAISYAKTLYENPKFYVFSDNIDEVKREFKTIKEENIKFIHRSILDDFVIMSRCSNNIIANSSYSWWAAYLNDLEDRVVIAPFPRYAQKYYDAIEGLNEEHKREMKEYYRQYAYPGDWKMINYE